MSDIKKLRHRCFFDITIGDKQVGRIVFELFNDICPKTCDNFRSLCTGEKGLGKTTGKPLHYKNVIFHRVVKNFIIQSGDFSMGNGRGGESIFGGTFNDENFILKHDKPYLLSMANRGKNTNGSQFFITLSPAPHLDGVHVVFGHVLSGQQIIIEIQNQMTGEDIKPSVDVMISNCGELIPQIKPKDKKKKNKKSNKKSDGEISSEEEDRDQNRAKNKKEKKHKKHKKSKENKDHEINSEDKESELLNPNCSVKAEEIPEIPALKFLSRIDLSQSLDQNREERTNSFRYNRYSRRSVKGRGPTRYRTPSPSHHYRSGSETPPHWKEEESRLVTLKEVICSKQRSYDRVYTQSDQRRNDWRQRNAFPQNNSRYDRDYDIRHRFRREGSNTDSNRNGNQQPSHKKRVFTEEPPISSKYRKSDSFSPKMSDRREDNNSMAYVSDSENFKNSEVQRHSVKSEVKMNVRNSREDSRDRRQTESREEEIQQSPSDIKNIPLPDTDYQKLNSNKKSDKRRDERTDDSKGFKREHRHRRSESPEKLYSSQRISSRRRDSNDSN